MTEGNEQIPSATMLPEGLEPYQQTPVFTEVSLPAGLRKDHSTELGVWGLIHVLEGQLLYTITDPRRTNTEINLNPENGPGVVEPTIVHHVASPGLVRFYVHSIVRLLGRLRCAATKNWPSARTLSAFRSFQIFEEAL